MSIGKQVDEIIQIKDAEISRYAHKSGYRINVINEVLKEIETDLDYLNTAEWTQCNVRHALRTYKHILLQAKK